MPLVLQELYTSQLFPDRMPDIKIILLLTLFDDQALGAYKRICDYAIETINGDLLAINGELNHLFITGFLKFKPLLDAERQKKPSRWNNKENHLKTFLKKYSKEIKKFSTLDLPLNYRDIAKHPLEHLEIIFNLIPVDTQNQEFLDIISIISPIASRHLLVKETGYSMQYHFRTKFFNRYAAFLLERKGNCIPTFIDPFKDHLTDSQESIYFIREIISAQDQNNKYENFWKIWNSLYSSVLKISKTKTSHYVSDLIQMYLLADYIWGSGKKEWHSLQDRDKQFYQNIVDDLGQRPATLYSLSKILTGIGSPFLNDGIGWLSEVINKQDDKIRGRSDDNTIFYLENLIRKYVYLNREKVRKDIRTKKQVITILNYLVECTSVNAYLLREDIL